MWSLIGVVSCIVTSPTAVDLLRGDATSESHKTLGAKLRRSWQSEHVLVRTKVPRGFKLLQEHVVDRLLKFLRENHSSTPISTHAP